MLQELVFKESNIAPRPQDFEFINSNRNFPKVKPFYLEKFNSIWVDLMVKEYGIAYEYLADYFSQQNNFDLAIKYYQLADNLDPYNLEIIGRLANNYAELGNSNKAIEYFNKALTIDQSNIIFHYNLGVIFGNLKEVDKARYEFQTVLQLDRLNSDLSKQASIFLKLLDNGTFNIGSESAQQFKKGQK
jgi:tetratricopeptide (TPR) repeat protein